VYENTMALRPPQAGGSWKYIAMAIFYIPCPSQSGKAYTIISP
jgi:hypothetical protein